MEDKVMMKDWKYPLTNIGKRGNCHQPRPTAKVRDAEGRELMSFAGLPYRRNHEAVAMASEFCEVMNRMYKQRRNCDVGTAEEQICRHVQESGLECNLETPCHSRAMECRKCFAKWSQLPYAPASAAPLAARNESAVGSPSSKVAIVRELFEDVLMMAEKYARKTPATTTVIFDRKTGKVEREVNYLETIEKAQAALSAAPETAHWIGVESETAICSKCGNDYYTGFETTAEATEKWGELYPFCPYCGAAMDLSVPYGGRTQRKSERGRRHRARETA